MLTNLKHESFVLKCYRLFRHVYSISLFLLCVSIVLSLSLIQSLQMAVADGYEKEPPKIAVSIKPLQSLVSAVTQDVTTPNLIVQSSGSAHGYQLRPQDAKNLSAADIVFWAGPEMETFLQKPLHNLSPNAEIVSLAAAPGMQILPARDGGAFEAHSHGHDDTHKIDEDSVQHLHEHDHEHDHHTDDDLHFWLDPENARVAINYIAEVLSKDDPSRASIYEQNAANYNKRLTVLEKRTNTELASVRGAPFIVFHDAYQYFEKRFSIPALGSITVDPEHTPGAKRVSEIRNKIKNLASATSNENSNDKDMKKNKRHVCVFSEPQFQPRLVQVLIAGTNAQTGVLDPLGADLKEGPDQYIQLIENLSSSLKKCLSSE